MKPRPKSKSRWLFAFVLPAMLLAACEEEVQTEAEIIRPVKAIKVGDINALRERWLPGQAKATREVELSFRVSGPIVEFPVKIGDTVVEGDVLAKMDPATYTAEADGAKANLSRAQATLRNAELELDRNQKLLKKGHVAQARVDQVLASTGEARADVAAAKAALDKAQLDLKYTTLRAPFEGTIVATYAENFEDVRAQRPVLRLLDDSRIDMVVRVPESVISIVPTVTDIVVVFDAFPDRMIPAEIKEIGTEASQTTRTYPITLTMAQPDDVKILPGMAGKVTGKSSAPEITGRTGHIVPVAAVFTPLDAEGTFVWVIDEAAGSVTRRAVKTGEMTNVGIRIADGLGSGEWIATAGVNFLRDGQKVRILEE